MTDTAEIIARALGGALFPDVHWLYQVRKVSFRVERDGSTQEIGLFPVSPTGRHGSLWDMVEEHILPEFEKRLTKAGLTIVPVETAKFARGLINDCFPRTSIGLHPEVIILDKAMIGAGK